jgi:repressor LexA
MLSARQSEILDFIRSTIDANGFPPSVREIGLHFKIASPNGVMCHLKALEAKGILHRRRGCARGVTLLGMKPLSRSVLPYAGTIS